MRLRCRWKGNDIPHLLNPLVAKSIEYSPRYGRKLFNGGLGMGCMYFKRSIFTSVDNSCIFAVFVHQLIAKNLNGLFEVFFLEKYSSIDCETGSIFKKGGFRALFSSFLRLKIPMSCIFRLFWVIF